MDIKRTFLPCLGLFASLCVSSAFAKLQEAPTNFRVEDMTLSGFEHVLHYGGIHSDSIALAHRLPKGSVDVQNPLQDTQPVSNLKYLSKHSSSEHSYDLVLVDDAFTQLSKQQSVLKALKIQMKSNAKLMMHLPQYKEGAIGRALALTWVDLQDELLSTSSYLIYPQNQYESLLKEAGLKVDRAQTKNQKDTFQDVKAFKEWLKTNWTYLQGLRPQDQGLFLDAFVHYYLKETAQQGPIVWDQQVLEIEASVG